MFCSGTKGQVSGFAGKTAVRHYAPAEIQADSEISVYFGSTYVSS